MDNQQIVVVFEQIAQLLEIQRGNPFRIRSYQRASELLQQLSLNIAQAIESQPVRLSAIPGIGKGTLSRIKEIVETGACRELQQLTAQIPLSLLELRRLRHLGPRRIYQIWKTLGIENLDDLQRAAEQQQLRTLPGLGVHSESLILESVDHYRLRLDTAHQFSRTLLEHLRQQVPLQRSALAGVSTGGGKPSASKISGVSPIIQAP